MKLEQSFDVAAPLERVWHALIDVEQVAPCLPGAAVTGRNDDGSYNGTFTVKIGPTTASYAGKLEMQDVNESAHTAAMHAHGSDKRGQGGATATILSTLTPAGKDQTHVEVVTDYHITGRLARFGRGGMIEDISNKLLRQFADRLQKSLVAQPSAAGAGVGGSEPATASASSEAGVAQATAAAGAANAAQAGAAPPGGSAAGAGDGKPATGGAAAGGAGEGAAGAPSGGAGGAAAGARSGGAGGASAGPPSGAPDEATVGTAEDRGDEWAPGGREGPLAEAEAPPADAAAPAPGAPPPPAPGGPPPPAPESPPPPAAEAPSPSQDSEGSEPIEGLSLMGSVLVGQIKRNGATIVAFVLGLLIGAALTRGGRR